MTPSLNKALELPEDGSIDAGLFIGALLVEEGIGWSSEDIAEMCGCTHQRIQQIEKGALRKLRQYCRAQRLRDAADGY